jgi:hypothetical protein
MWDLCWIKWYWDRFFSEPFSFPLSVSFHRCSIFTHVSSGGWTKGPLEAQFPVPQRHCIVIVAMGWDDVSVELGLQRSLRPSPSLQRHSVTPSHQEQKITKMSQGLRIRRILWQDLNNGKYSWDLNFERKGYIACGTGSLKFSIEKRP